MIGDFQSCDSIPGHGTTKELEFDEIRESDVDVLTSIMKRVFYEDTRIHL